MSTSSRGAASLFVLATIALVVALFLAGMGAQKPLTPGQTLALAGAAAVALAALAVEFRRDDHDAAMFTVVAAFVWALVLGAVALLGVERHPVAGGVATLSAAAFVGSLVHVVRVRLSVDPVPDVLAQAFGGAVVETDGVQWVALPPPDEVTAAGRSELRVWLQNTHDAPREVRVHAELERGLVGPARSPVRLAPLEVGALAIPLSARPDASGTHDVRIWIEAEGEGRRVRRARRTHASRRLSPVFQGLAVLASLHNPLEAFKLLRPSHGVKLGVAVRPAEGFAGARAVTARWESRWRVEGSRFAVEQRAGLVR